jgi:hypothetical protein
MKEKKVVRASFVVQYPQAFTAARSSEELTDSMHALRTDFSNEAAAGHSRLLCAKCVKLCDCNFQTEFPKTLYEFRYE